MAMETAAAILAKLTFEQNNDFRARLSSAPADENTLVMLIMPLFRRILSQMQEQQQARDAFPSATADSGHVLRSDGRAKNTR
jgi:hypothetical protein